MNGRQLADATRVSRPGLQVLFITGYAENAVLNHGHLQDVSNLLGTRKVNSTSTTYSDASTSQSVQKNEAPVLTVDELRRLPTGMGLMTYRNRRGVLLDMPGWTERVDADTVARVHERIEGWPMGLQLLLVDVEKEADRVNALRRVAATGGKLNTLFADVILPRLDREDVEFLTAISPG